MMTIIHEKRLVSGEECEWYVDVTLNDGRRVQGFAFLDFAVDAIVFGGSDFHDGEGFPIDMEPSDWCIFQNADDTSQVSYVMPEVWRFPIRLPNIFEINKQ